MNEQKIRWYCHLYGVCMTIRWVLYCMISFFDNLYFQLVTTINYRAIAISTIYRSPLHTQTLRSSVFTSRNLATDFNTVVIPISHMKSFLHSLIPFLPLFCQLSTLEVTSILILIQSQSYFTTGGLPTISSSLHQAPWDPRPEFFISTEFLR
jgi:hypothetical protein